MATQPTGLKLREEHLCHGGKIQFYEHFSHTLALPALFGVFLPPAACAGQKVPVVYALAGLTCTEETFLIKSTALAEAARLGLALVAPDTSPRGAGVPEEDKDWDLGTGAGFLSGCHAAALEQTLPHGQLHCAGTARNCRASLTLR